MRSRLALASAFAFAATGIARADSPADVRSAEFPTNALFAPAALAGDAAGNVYVADIAAQRVSRVSPSGEIALSAGGNPAAPGGLYALGSFGDGAAALARFRHPGGLALARDGSLYVADTYNHCIRRIAGGVVTTFAGRFDRSEAVDGPLASARFKYPRALAFDTAGNLYVADFTVGLREITPAGIVSTLALPGIGASTTALSAYSDARTTVLFASDDLRTVAVDLATRRADAWGAPPVGAPDPAIHYHPLEGERETGRMSALAALGPQSFAYADARSGDVRLIVRDAMGTLSREPLGAPLGIARAGDTLAISDTRHHRIVRLPLPDVRSFTDTVPPRKDARAFRVAVVGDSFAFYDTLWDSSIEGVLENRLRADVARRGSQRIPETFAARFASLDALRSYVDADLETGQVDAIVLLVDSPLVYVPIYGGNDWGSNLAANPDRWRAAFVAGLQRFASAAAAKRIPLVTIAHPMAIELSPYENLDAREAQSGGVASEDGAASYAALVDAMRSAGLRATFDLGPAMLARERALDRPALFGSYDFHFSAEGRAFVADEIANALESDPLWASL